MVAFEAAVAGGIPIIKALREGLTANRIQWMAGIINGTTNFILSEMRDKGLDFDVVLKEAQRLGYAEADPTFDIEGVDAAHKATLMSAIAFGIPCSSTRPTSKASPSWRRRHPYAEQLGYRIKLLGITKRRTRASSCACTTLMPAKRLIANVEGAMNAVLVQGDAVGHAVLRQGRRAEPTASAVIADLVDITRLHTADPSTACRPGLPARRCWQRAARAADGRGRDQLLPAPARGRRSRRAGQDHRHPGRAGISIDAVLQREADEVGGEGSTQTDLIILTHDTREGDMDKALAEMQGLPTVLAPITRIRKEELN
jgi:homoserine dehydrogenase